MSNFPNLNVGLTLVAPTNLSTVRRQIEQGLGSVKLDFKVPKNLKVDIGASATAINKFSDSVSKANAVSKTAADNILLLSNAFNNLKRSVTNVNTDKVNSGLRAISKSTRQVVHDSEDFGRVLAITTRRYAAFTIAATSGYRLAGAFTAGIKEAFEFQNEMVRVSQVTGKAGVSLKNISTEIGRLSRTFGVSSKGLSEIATTLAQAGLSANDTKVALEALAKTTLAPTFSDISKTTEGAIAIMRQFKIEAGQLEGVLGSINAVAAAYAVESQDIVDATKRAGAAFRAAGGSFNEFIALFTSVRETTRESAETISTGFRTIFTRLQRPQTIKFLESLGIELTDAEGKFIGAYKAVGALSSVLSRLDTRNLQFAQIVEELGGYRQISRVIPLIQEYGKAQQALAIAQAGQASLSRDAARAQESLIVQFSRVKEEFLSLIRALSEDTVIKSLISNMLTLTSSLIKVADNLRPLLPLIAALGAVQAIKIGSGVAKGFEGFLETPKVIRRGNGGPVPGVGNTDSVPAYLTPGEYVLKKDAVKAIGLDNLRQFNTGRVRFARGGLAKRVFKDALLGSGMNRVRKSIDNFDTDEILKNIPKGAETLGFGVEAITFKSGKDVYRLGYGKVERPPLPELLQSKSTKYFTSKDGSETLTLEQLPYINTARKIHTKLQRLAKTFGPNASSYYRDYVNQLIEQLENSIENRGYRAGDAHFDNVGFTGRGKNRKFILFDPGYIEKKNKGGAVDNVPAMLTPGEFVFSKEAVDRIGVHNLDRMNKIQKFNTGGYVRKYTNKNKSVYIKQGSSLKEQGLPNLTGIKTSSLNLELSNLDGANRIKRQTDIESALFKTLKEQLKSLSPTLTEYQTSIKALNILTKKLQPGTSILIDEFDKSKVYLTDFNKRIQRVGKASAELEPRLSGILPGYGGAKEGIGRGYAGLKRSLAGYAKAPFQSVQNFGVSGSLLLSLGASGLENSGFLKNQFGKETGAAVGAGLSGAAGGFAIGTGITSLLGVFGKLNPVVGLLITGFSALSGAVDSFSQALRNAEIEKQTERLETSQRAFDDFITSLGKTPEKESELRDRLNSVVGNDSIDLNKFQQQLSQTNFIERGLDYGINASNAITRGLFLSNTSNFKTKTYEETRQEAASLETSGIRDRLRVILTNDITSLLNRAFENGKPITNTDELRKQLGENVFNQASNVFRGDTSVFSKLINEINSVNQSSFDAAEKLRKFGEELIAIEDGVRDITNIFENLAKNTTSQVVKNISEIDVRLGNANPFQASLARFQAANNSRDLSTELGNFRGFIPSDSFNTIDLNLRFLEDLQTKLPDLQKTLERTTRLNYSNKLGEEVNEIRKNVDSFFDTSLAPYANSPIFKSLRNTLGESLNELSGTKSKDTFEKAQQNIQSVVESLLGFNLDLGKSSVITQLQQITDQFNKLQDVLGKVSDSQLQYLSNLDRSDNLRIEQIRLQSQFDRRVADPNQINNIINGQINRYTQGLNPDEIAQRVINNRNRIPSLNTLDTQNQLEINGINAENNKLLQGLEKLADASTRTAAILDKLGEVNEKRSRIQGLGSEFYGSDAQGRIRILQDFGLAKQALDKGSLDGFTPEQQQRIVSALPKLEGVGRVPLDATSKLIENTSGFGKLLGKALRPLDSEKLSLEKQAIAVYDSSIKATEALSKIQQDNTDRLLAASNDLVISLNNLKDSLRQDSPGIPPQRLSRGGTAFSPRGTDVVPAMLSPGEYIINSKSSKKYSSLLKAINKDTLYAAEGYTPDVKTNAQINKQLTQFQKAFGIDPRKLFNKIQIEDFIEPITKGTIVRGRFNYKPLTVLLTKLGLKQGTLSHELGHSLFKQLGGLKNEEVVKLAETFASKKSGLKTPIIQEEVLSKLPKGRVINENFADMIRFATSIGKNSSKGQRAYANDIRYAVTKLASERGLSDAVPDYLSEDSYTKSFLKKIGFYKTNRIPARITPRIPAKITPRIPALNAPTNIAGDVFGTIKKADQVTGALGKQKTVFDVFAEYEKKFETRRQLGFLKEDFKNIDKIGKLNYPGGAVGGQSLFGRPNLELVQDNQIDEIIRNQTLSNRQVNNVADDISARSRIKAALQEGQINKISGDIAKQVAAENQVTKIADDLFNNKTTQEFFSNLKPSDKVYKPPVSIIDRARKGISATTSTIKGVGTDLLNAGKFIGREGLAAGKYVGKLGLKGLPFLGSAIDLAVAGEVGTRTLRGARQSGTKFDVGFGKVVDKNVAQDLAVAGTSLAGAAGLGAVGAVATGGLAVTVGLPLAVGAVGGGLGYAAGKTGDYIINRQSQKQITEANKKQENFDKTLVARKAVLDTLMKNPNYAFSDESAIKGAFEYFGDDSVKNPVGWKAFQSSYPSIARVIGESGYYKPVDKIAGRLNNYIFTNPNVKKFSRGGQVPGYGRGDKVPALLEPDEFVLNRAAAKSIGFDKLNRINRMAAGGRVRKNETQAEFQRRIIEEGRKKAEARRANTQATIEQGKKRQAEFKSSLVNIGNGISVTPENAALYKQGVQDNLNTTNNSDLALQKRISEEVASGKRKIKVGFGASSESSRKVIRSRAKENDFLGTFKPFMGKRGDSDGFRAFKVDENLRESVRNSLREGKRVYSGDEQPNLPKSVNMPVIGSSRPRADLMTPNGATLLPDLSPGMKNGMIRDGQRFDENTVRFNEPLKKSDQKTVPLSSPNSGNLNKILRSPENRTRAPQQLDTFTKKLEDTIAKFQDITIKLEIGQVKVDITGLDSINQMHTELKKWVVTEIGNQVRKKFDEMSGGGQPR